MGKNFVDHLREKLLEFGDTRTYTFLREAHDDGRTFRVLDERAREIAEMVSRRTAPGDRALLLYPSGPEFLEAFLGCLYAGVLAVPAPVAQYRHSLDRLTGILTDAGVELILTTAEDRAAVLAQIAEHVPADRPIDCAATDSAGIGDAAAWRQPEIAADSVAYLQYTSGSTSEPKGVMVTHANLLHNCAVIAEIWQLDAGATMAGWVPHFHDMGMVGMLLAPLYAGANCVHCAPLSFVKRPVRWLEMLSRFRATATAAPDFAYELCVRQVTAEQVSTLDLSSLRVVVDGAEPVRPATLDTFAEKFAPAGFRREIAAAGYGLAEATLVVASAAPEDGASVRHVQLDALSRNEVRLAPANDGWPLVGHGGARGCEIRIVDPATTAEVGEGRVGEIWVGGPSVAGGYWNQPEVSEETFRAHTSSGAGPFLRTGDLGFLLEGELFVTGRHKDLIVMQGRNIYPQDVEQAVRQVDSAVLSRQGAAFSVRSDREHLVLVQEIRARQVGAGGLADLAERIQQAVVRRFDVSFPSILLVDRPVPRTTSGKVQRRATRERFLAGELSTVHAVLHPAVESALREPGGVLR
ncbi:fatty acyl-AMP ligase [Amycolatopsis sp. GM8]|uniref:fatty acyl-AMP ligase n=1 Tax=Amycolatopsis sp. GM8 TaxID=2896530 RepID=UPI001F38D477|nr:fatty acyl-AMP ligase [Amycolatopsis sp. GM8]